MFDITMCIFRHSFMPSGLWSMCVESFLSLYIFWFDKGKQSYADVKQESCTTCYPVHISIEYLFLKTMLSVICLSWS